MQAVGLLRDLGYTRTRHYSGGIQDWTEHSGPLEKGNDRAPAARAGGGAPARLVSAGRRTRSPLGASSGRRSEVTPSSTRRWRVADFLEALSNRSVGGLLRLWLWMVAAFGLAYWLFGFLRAHHGLVAGGAEVPATLGGLLTAIYFSFVTATSVGYGDVVPLGLVRVLAVAESAAGLLLFGCVISKLLSRRQEELIAEIHRTTFEDRLGRLRTNLHLVLSELQANIAMCADQAIPRERTLARVESAVMVFTGELRAVHDLLYRPQQVPEEPVLEAMLANLAAIFNELVDLLACLPEAAVRSATFRMNLRSIQGLAEEICGECVPREYAPELKGWMDQIQGYARQLPAG